MVMFGGFFKKKTKEEEVTVAPVMEDASDDKELQEVLDVMDNAWEDDETTLSLGYANNYTVELVEKAHVCIGKLHGIGAREMQQDSFGNSEVMIDEQDRRVVLVVVADGMGGMSCGEKASMETVIASLSYFDNHAVPEDPHEYMMDMAEYANDKVRETLGSDSNSGSTLISALIREQTLFFNSVGDSHIVLWRDGELVQLNTDHNYANVLQRQVEQGLITQEEAMNAKQRNALTSFIGVESLDEIDGNKEPIQLLSGDRILLMSDGVYNTVPNVDISEAMKYPVDRSAMFLEMVITKANKRNQDNYTCLIVEVQ